MGCGSSSNDQFRLALRHGVYQDLKLLGLSESDMEMFYQIFRKCDVTMNGTLEFQEFFVYFRLPDNRLSRRVFSFVEGSMDRKVDFREVMFSICLFD